MYKSTSRNDSFGWESIGLHLLADATERAIVDQIRISGGEIFRDQLRRKIRGSNTTFVKKISRLKGKGLIEETKKSDGRIKTVYRFTLHASRLLDIVDALKHEKWFSASQKIELFPELEQMAKLLTGKQIDVYKTLGLEPTHMFLETSLASSESPNLADREIRESLAMCNAFLQEIVATRFHQDSDKSVEGYIIFRYKFERPKEEIQKTLPQCLTDYISTNDPLKKHKASSQLVELSIKYPEVLPRMVIVASNIARHLNLVEQETYLRNLYKKFESEFEQINRTHTAIAILEIFRTLYNTHHTTGGGKTTSLP